MRLGLLVLAVPFLLTLIPLHSPVLTAIRTVDSRGRSMCGTASAAFFGYADCAIGGRCCPIARSLFGTTRCTPDGASCYEPVLGNWGLAGVMAVLSVLSCVVELCCGWGDADVVGDDSGRAGVVQPGVVHGRGNEVRVVGDGRRYQRMTEVVELR